MTPHHRLLLSLAIFAFAGISLAQTPCVQAVQKFAWANNNGANTPQALTTLYRTEQEKWGRIIRELGIQPN